MSDLTESLAAAKRENEWLKELIALRRENAELRLQLGLPGDEREALARIVSLVCAEFDVQEEQLHCRTRTELVCFPRHVAFWLLREFTTLSCHAIGNYFQRDHSAILHGAESVRWRLGDKRYRTRLEQLRERAREALGLEANGTSHETPANAS